MSPAVPRVCVLVASPRSGRCERLADDVSQGVALGGAEPFSVLLRSYAFEGCTGCGVCSHGDVCPLTLEEDDIDPAHGFRAVFESVNAADALVVVSPIYFAGPPAHYKAFIDRLEFLWAKRYLLGEHPLLPQELRKCAGLIAVGEGGDPYGFDPLVTCTRSALHMMDFEVEQVVDATVTEGASQRSHDVGLEVAKRTLRRLNERC